MGGRVPDVDADGVVPVLRAEWRQAPRDLLERLFETGRLVAPVAAHERLPKPVGILVQVPEGNALRAQVAVAEDIVRIAPDRDDPLARHLDLQAAGGLADRADAQLGHGHDVILRTRGMPPGLSRNGYLRPPGRGSASSTSARGVPTEPDGYLMPR